jgi:hypothetical protein
MAPAFRRKPPGCVSPGTTRCVRNSVRYCAHLCGRIASGETRLSALTPLQRCHLTTEIDLAGLPRMSIGGHHDPLEAVGSPLT